MASSKIQRMQINSCKREVCDIMLRVMRTFSSYVRKVTENIHDGSPRGNKDVQEMTWTFGTLCVFFAKTFTAIN